MTDETTEPTVQALVEGAQTLAARLPKGLRRLRLKAGDHSVEVEWELAPAGMAPAGPAGSAHSGPAVAEESAVTDDDTGHAVVAPLVGTYYACPEPGADPFVVEGDVVEEGQDVAIVEAMKIMNRIAADASGTVRRILVADGEMVEFGQRLMIIDVG